MTIGRLGLTGLLLFLIGAAHAGVPETHAPGASPPSGRQIVVPTSIKLLPGEAGISFTLEDELAVGTDATVPLNAADYVLFLDSRPILGLDDRYYDPVRHALVFRLERKEENQDNVSAWREILGAPKSLTKSLTVGLGHAVPAGQTPVQTILAADQNLPVISFSLATLPRFLTGSLLVLGVLVLLCFRANRSMLLKDNLVPQIDPRRQPFSLARCQMAFWFLLILACYVFLFIALNTPNSLSDQALMLMGISGATAFGAIAVDVAKDTPPDTLNKGLQLLGIKTYADVQRIAQEIENRRITLGNPANPPSPAAAAILSSEIVDRQMVLRSYEAQIKPFVSDGPLNDILSDANGTALHRLQIVCWTLVLGAIFLIEVWQGLAMPTFNVTLLALMGISGAGYVGFKYSEAS